MSAGTRIRYMGNKQQLADEVAVYCNQVSPKRRLVDLFGGMGSVAGATAASGRSVWLNDVQDYAQLAARCLIASSDAPPSADAARRVLRGAYRANLMALRERYANELLIERNALRSGDTAMLGRVHEAWRHAANDEDVAEEVRSLREGPREGPWRMTVLIFAWGYFGLKQSAALDSIRYSIEEARRLRLVTEEVADWMRLAWLQTASRIASAPGHFAQFLRPNSRSGANRIMAARRRPVWASFLDDLSALKPYGTAQWRTRNAVLGFDALSIWPRLDDLRVGPAIYYADPPYSKDHYSRYYHVLETLARYDYPPARGSGRYRPDRFRSSFGVKSEVVASVTTMAKEVAKRDGVLLLSYPSTGLLTAGLGVDPAALLEKYFDDVEVAIARPARHSTLGARHGSAAQEVVEYVWAAR